MLSKIFATTVAVAAFAAPTAIADAGPDWGTVQAPVQQDGDIVSLAVHGDGSAAISTSARIGGSSTNQAAQVAYRTAGGAFAPILTPDNAASLAFGPDGALYAASEATSGGVMNVGVAGRSAAGAIVPWAPLAPSESSATAGKPHVSLAFADDGSELVAWRGPGSDLRWSLTTTSGTTTGATSDNSYTPSDPAIAINGAGDALVAWESASSIEIASRTAGEGDAFGSPVTLPVAGPLNAFGGGSLRVAIGPNGRAITAWDADVNGYDVTEVATRADADASWSTPISLPGWGNGPAVAVDASGTPIVTWDSRTDNGGHGDDGQDVATLTPAGALATQQHLTNYGAEQAHTEIATAADGTALIAWAGGGGAYASVRKPGGAFEPAVVVGVLGTFGSDPVKAGLSDAGEGLVAWRGGYRRYDAVSGPGTPAPSVDVPPPATTTPADPTPTTTTTTTPVVTTTAPPAPAPPARPTVRPAAAVTCRVPSLAGLTAAAARRKLAAARCRLGRVVTPKKYKKSKGLVIRAQSRRSHSSARSGSTVDVTLGPKAKAKK